MNSALTMIAILLALSAAGCTSRSDRSAAAERDAHDPNSPAFKAGEVAHKVAKETGKIAEKAGERLREGAREASAGWKKSAAEDRKKKEEKP